MQNDDVLSTQTGANQSEETGSHRFGALLTIPEAVQYALIHDLSRTPKTFRKWCARNEVAHKKENTGNGYRYLLERASLDLKIEEEKEIQAAKQTGAHSSERVPTGSNTFEPVPTGSNGDLIEILKEQVIKKDEQIERKDAQIRQLNNSLDAQAEKNHELAMKLGEVGIVLGLKGAEEKNNSKNSDSDTSISVRKIEPSGQKSQDPMNTDTAEQVRTGSEAEVQTDTNQPVKDGDQKDNQIEHPESYHQRSDVDGGEPAINSEDLGAAEDRQMQ